MIAILRKLSYYFEESFSSIGSSVLLPFVGIFCAWITLYCYPLEIIVLQNSRAFILWNGYKSNNVFYLMYEQQFEHSNRNPKLIKSYPKKSQKFDISFFFLYLKVRLKCQWHWQIYSWQFQFFPLFHKWLELKYNNCWHFKFLHLCIKNIFYDYIYGLNSLRIEKYFWGNLFERFFKSFSCLID